MGPSMSVVCPRNSITPLFQQCKLRSLLENSASKLTGTTVGSHCWNNNFEHRHSFCYPADVNAREVVYEAPFKMSVYSKEYTFLQSTFLTRHLDLMLTTACDCIPRRPEIITNSRHQEKSFKFSSALQLH